MLKLTGKYNDAIIMIDTRSGKGAVIDEFTR